MKLNSLDIDGIFSWLLFEVLIPLVPLFLLPLVYYLYQTPWHWEDVVACGSLLLYATTIASKAVGQHYRKLESYPSKVVCITVLVVIVMLSTCVYTLVVLASLPSIEGSLSQERVAWMSTWIAFASLIFSSALAFRADPSSQPKQKAGGTGVGGK